MSFKTTLMNHVCAVLFTLQNNDSLHYYKYRSASIGKPKLEVGDEVSYNIAFTNKGLEAINVHLKKPIAV